MSTLLIIFQYPFSNFKKIWMQFLSKKMLNIIPMGQLMIWMQILKVFAALRTVVFSQLLQILLEKNESLQVKIDLKNALKLRISEFNSR